MFILYGKLKGKESKIIITYEGHRHTHTNTLLISIVVMSILTHTSYMHTLKLCFL